MWISTSPRRVPFVSASPISLAAAMPAVLYLDRYHLGDPLFLNGFARDVLASPEPLIIVHGSGESAERALEAQGRMVAWTDGILNVETDTDRALVERSARELNRQIAHTLNEAGVASVRLDASSRGLLKATGTGLAVKKIDWLRTLVAQGAVPVLTALMSREEGPAREVNGGSVAGAIAAALTTEDAAVPVVMLAKKRPGDLESPVSAGGDGGAEAVPKALYDEPEALNAALRAGGEVRLIGRADLRSGALDGVRSGNSVDNKSA